MAFTYIPIPNILPAYNKHYPIIHSTLLSIMPSGFTMKPAIHKPAPNTSIIIADITAKLSLVSFVIR